MTGAAAGSKHVRGEERRGEGGRPGASGLPLGVAGLRRIVLLAERGTPYKSKADAIRKTRADSRNMRN